MAWGSASIDPRVTVATLRGRLSSGWRLLRAGLVLGATLVASGPQLAGAAPAEHVVPDLRGETRARPRSKIRMIRIPLTIHIAIGDEKIAFDPDRLNRAVVRANEALRTYGIEIYVARVALLPEGFAAVRHRRDRRKLAAFAPVDGTIHVFLVGRLELGHFFRPDRSVRGLHWRYRGLFGRMRNREYLIVSNDAPITTLVHEVGHLFGLEHDLSKQNLMCSCRQGPRQIFTAAQGALMRRGAVVFMNRKG